MSELDLDATSKRIEAALQEAANAGELPGLIGHWTALVEVHTADGDMLIPHLNDDSSHISTTMGLLHFGRLGLEGRFWETNDDDAS